MKWKEIKKLILFSIPVFILILLITFLVHPYWLECLSTCSSNNLPPNTACPESCVTINLFAAPVVQFLGLDFLNQHFIITLILSLLIWYFVSLIITYLIVWIFNKTKKKE